MLVPWHETLGTEVHCGGVDSAFLTMSLHVLLLLCHLPNVPPTLDKTFIATKTEISPAHGCPALKPQSCPAPLVLMSFSQANSVWPEKQHQGREWRVVAAATRHLSVASPSPPRCEGTHSLVQHHGQHAALHPICFPSQYEHRLGLSSNPERTSFSPVFWGFF